MSQTIEANATSRLFEHLSFPATDSKPNTRHSRRTARRQKLLDENPHCHHCGRLLTSEDGRMNTASLFRDRLSCPIHFDIVGKSARDHHSVICNPPRSRLMKKQMAMDKCPQCSACGIHLTMQPGLKNTAAIFNGRLSCQAHKNLVRLAAQVGIKAAIEQSLSLTRNRSMAMTDCSQTAQPR